MTNYIWITTEKIGFHNWPEAPEEVEFLQHKHRHKFMFKVAIEVGHNDRDIEFFLFKRFVDGVLVEIFEELEERASCEMIAHDLWEEITIAYPNRHIKISVSEDGEVGVDMDYPVVNLEQE